MRAVLPLSIALQLTACGYSTVVADEGESAPGGSELRTGTVATQLYWSDGDSGRINGKPFRLADIDAPETGAVGAQGGAKCEAERELGFAAKEWVVDLTRTGRAGDAVVVVTDLASVDRYGRQALSLSVDGQLLSTLGIRAGRYRTWPHRNGRAQSPKPDWCAGQP